VLLEQAYQTLTPRSPSGPDVTSERLRLWNVNGWVAMPVCCPTVRWLNVPPRGHWGVMSDDETPLVALLQGWETRARELLDDAQPREHPEGVLSTADLAERARTLRELRWFMMPRETQKVCHLWPALRRHLGAAPVEALRERKVNFERLFIQLRWVDERSRAFDSALASLITQVEDYLRQEEQILPDVATKVPAAEQRAVARRLAIHRGWYPVQPHPDVPARPWLASAVKPVAAAFDRLRDALTTAPG
jgi:hypothetical protein